MPFDRPTLQQIDDRIRNDIAGRMRINNTARTASLFRRSVVAVLSRVYAGSCHLLYGFLAWLARQRFAHSMEGEFLDAEGLTYALPRKPADFAVGQAVFSGADGATIPAGTLCQNDDRRQYRVAAAIPAAGGTGAATFQAVEAGAGGNLQPGSALRLVTPIAGVQGGLTVGVDGFRGGVDMEGDDSYRERILDRKREPPHGGSKHDYEQWALQVPGVTRAWCLPLRMGEGTVGLMFARDGDASILPAEEQCREVFDHIEPLRPVTAKVYVFPPVEKPVDITVKLSPDAASNREAVVAELRDFVIREGAPGVTLRVSRISEAISSAVGEHHHYLEMPANDIPVAENELPVLGLVTFVDNPNG
ncbi:MAG: baseplate J/gp47 family protein [Planctomycetota bacterium]|jgi:uncharacterized phage protein gp47/JayE|nr:baseplate J/gp47 family protein [Planctomycetota bacterium]